MKMAPWVVSASRRVLACSLDPVRGRTARWPTISRDSSIHSMVMTLILQITAIAMSMCCWLSGNPGHCEAIRLWCRKFGPVPASELRPAT
jgi:hypothetical protein